MVTFYIDPVPKPRMTKSDVWKNRPSVKRYWEFKDRLLKQAKGSLEPTFTVTFNIEMPKSWSKKKKSEMWGKPHQSKPDIDNYLKAFMDALCEDDSFVYDVRARKYWAFDKGSIELEETTCNNH